MLYLAKRLKLITSNSFASAMEEFIRIYPNYDPGLGIRLFLSQNWDEIN